MEKFSLKTIWHVTREYAGLAEAGGLKDVPRGLAEAAIKAGYDVSAVLPYYGFMKKLALPMGSPVFSGTITLRPGQSQEVEIYKTFYHGVTIYPVSAAIFADKDDPYVYTKEGEAGRPGRGHVEADEMNVLLQKAVLALAVKLGAPDVFHLHDGHSAFIPIMARLGKYSKAFEESSFVLTIHNAGVGYHQRLAGPDDAAALLELPKEALERGIIDGGVDPLALASYYARLTTVSPQYARDLYDPANATITGGLSAFYYDQDVHIIGLYNGISLDSVDPRDVKKSGLPEAFDPSKGDFAGKCVCRQEFLKEIRSLTGDSVTGYGALDPEFDGPLFVFQGRIVSQKGVAFLIDGLRIFFHKERQAGFVFMGRGEIGLEEALVDFCSDPYFNGRVLYLRGYEERLAKLLVAAGDFFLAPSVYEPCGIADLTAQAVGTLPVAHATGGLGKILDGETGFLFNKLEPTVIAKTLDRVNARYWEDFGLVNEMRRAAFLRVIDRFTWDTVFKLGYESLYLNLNRIAVAGC